MESEFGRMLTESGLWLRWVSGNFGFVIFFSGFDA